MIRSAETDRDRIELAYRRTLARDPTAEETAAGVDFLTRQSQRIRNEGRANAQLPLPRDLPDDEDRHQAAALVSYCLALLNLSEFIYLE